MARIIPAVVINECDECPLRQDGGNVEDICGSERRYIFEDYDYFPSFCPLDEVE